MVADPSEKAKSASELLAIGRRDFICQDYDNASENFSKCCELLSQEFGEKSLEAAEGYFWYGKALWEVSRGRNDFLGEEAENDEVKPKEGTEDEKEKTEVKSVVGKLNPNKTAGLKLEMRLPGMQPPRMPLPNVQGM